MLKFLLLFLPLLSFAKGDKQIVGRDGRVQIKELTDPFHKSVGLLEREGAGFCTATLIDPTHILTNAHCIVVNNKKFPTTLEHPSKFTFVPGKLSKDHAPFGVFEIVRIDTFKVYADKGVTTHDIAVLKLNKPAKLPYLGRLKVGHNVNIDNKALKITGYSSAKPAGTMWEGEGVTLDADANNNLVTHDVDTLPGTSGALLRIKWGNRMIGVGVHRGPVGHVNNAVYFSPEVFDAINRWVKN